jgi:sRNA-binding regulator protein Hfq
MTYARNQFYVAMKSQIEKYDNYLIALTVDDKMNCSDYIFIISEIKRALATVRNDYAVKHYSEEISLWWWEGPLEREVSKIIPLRIMEISQTADGKTGHAPNTAKANTEHE